MKIVARRTTLVLPIGWLAAGVMCLSVSLLSSCYAQSVASSTAGAPSAEPVSAVYEEGDICLPSSRVYVFVGKTGLGHDHGVVGKVKSGRINLNTGRDAGGLDFDMSSFLADTPEARKFVRLEGQSDASTQRQVNANMLGADVLNVAQFPTARFVIREVARQPQLSQQGLAQYRLKGDFWLHGVTRPIEVVADADDQNGWTRLRGSFTMMQSQFGITPFTKAFGAVGVADQLTVWGDIWISKQRQAAPPPTVQR